MVQNGSTVLVMAVRTLPSTRSPAKNPKNAPDAKAPCSMLAASATGSGTSNRAPELTDHPVKPRAPPTQIAFVTSSVSRPRWSPLRTGMYSAYTSAPARITITPTGDSAAALGAPTMAPIPPSARSSAMTRVRSIGSSPRTVEMTVTHAGYV